jgi:hypothetical protein
MTSAEPKLFELGYLQSINADIDRWGCKATILSQLCREGLPVPKGLVVGSEWLDKYRTMIQSSGILCADSDSFQEFHLALQSCGWRITK